MGADRMLDEQRYGEERRLQSLTHVVVDLVTSEVYGPYAKGSAPGKRRKVLMKHPTRGKALVVVRKMRKEP
jgi:hypothetical protein